MQLDALAAAHCREVIVETASTRGTRPKLHAVLDALKPGDTLVIYKPDRIARSMKELLVLLEDELHAHEVNLEILTGICAGLHKPSRASPTRCCSWSPRWPLRWSATSSTSAPWTAWPPPTPQGRYGGRPPAVDDDTLAIARARRTRGESVTAIARHLKIGRSTLYRALADTEPAHT
jgi:DNA invertase Pin-like site-specific DNA recombinase